MDENWSLLLFCLLANIEPQVIEEMHVGPELFFRLAFSGRPQNESTGNACAMGLQNTLQPLPFFIGADLPGHSDVVHRWHVNDKSPWQRNVRGDARTLC